MKYGITPWGKEWERWPNLWKKGALETFFDDVFNPERQLQAKQYMPAVDVEETEKEYVLKVDLPGFKREDINVELHDRRLTISGTRKEERVEKSKGYHLEERAYGEFKRSFEMPENVDSEKVDAAYENGVLMLRVHKATPLSSRKIQIKG